MKKAIFIILMMTAVSAHSAKYAGESFSLGVGGRALGMGGAAIAGPFDGSAAYWNPAGMNYLSGRNIMAMHAETFGSLLNHDFVAFSSNRDDTMRSIRAYGFYFYYLGGGGIKLTGWDATRNRPYVIAEASHGDYLFAGAISGKIRKRIDIGVTARIIYRDVGGAVKGYGLTADVGLLYKIDRQVQLGLVVTDLTSGYIRYSGGYSESILPTVKPGVLISHKIKDFTGRLAATGDIKFEGRRAASQFWLKDLSLDTHLGLEISYKGMLFGRAGFDIGNLTAGLGIDIRQITIDLAYLHNDFLDETFRVSAGYRF